MSSTMTGHNIWNSMKGNLGAGQVNLSLIYMQAAVELKGMGNACKCPNVRERRENAGLIPGAPSFERPLPWAGQWGGVGNRNFGREDLLWTDFELFRIVMLGNHTDDSTTIYKTQLHPLLHLYYLSHTVSTSPVSLSTPPHHHHCSVNFWSHTVSGGICHFAYFVLLFLSQCAYSLPIYQLLFPRDPAKKSSGII